MTFPAYSDDAYWTDVIEQYIQNNNKHPGWYNIEYYMWEYFKNCLRRNNRFFFEHPLLPVLKAEFERNVCTLPQETVMYRARIDCDSKLWNEWNEYCRIASTPKELKYFEKRGLPADKLAAIQKECEVFINSEETQRIKQRIESGFQGFDAKGSSAPPIAQGTVLCVNCCIHHVLSFTSLVKKTPGGLGISKLLHKNRPLQGGFYITFCFSRKYHNSRSELYHICHRQIYH